MRLFLPVAMCAAMISESAISQTDADRYLQLKEIADSFTSYTVSLREHSPVAYITPNQLTKVFDESFSFLQKKHRPGRQNGKNLQIIVDVDEPVIYLPTTQKIYDPSFEGGLTTYNVITKYTMTVWLLVFIRRDSNVAIPLCIDKFFNKEGRVGIADLNSPVGRNGFEFTNLHEALNFQKKRFDPNAADFKESLLNLLDYYRRKINVRNSGP